MAHAQRAKTTGGARGLDEGLLRSHLYPHLHDATDKIVFEHERERIEGAFKSEKDRVQAMVETAMKRVTDLAGQWSVDILMDEGDNLWLIDMAIAQRSAYWEKRPEGYAE